MKHWAFLGHSIHPITDHSTFLVRRSQSRQSRSVSYYDFSGMYLCTQEPPMSSSQRYLFNWTRSRQCLRKELQPSWLESINPPSAKVDRLLILMEASVRSWEFNRFGLLMLIQMPKRDLSWCKELHNVKATIDSMKSGIGDWKTRNQKGNPRSNNRKVIDLVKRSHEAKNLFNEYQVRSSPYL